jgi:hypothetical protein
MMSKKVPSRIAVMTFDPGGTTGVAWGAMKVRDTLAATLQGAFLASCDITGEYQQQADKLHELWTGLSYAWTVEEELAADDVHLVSEGFSLHKIGSREKVGLYPVWISAMFEGMLWQSGTRVVYQEPSTKSRSTTERMKRWGCWERGVSQHRKDAMKHLAYFVNGLI